MKILTISQVEDKANLEQQIAKQTVQPDRIAYFTDTSPAEGVNARRIRIAENHQALRDFVIASSCDLVWQLEQDCILPEDCLERLLKDYEELKDEKFGYISGIQVGRHGIYCIGAWYVSKNSFHSIHHQMEGIHRIDATGFYCLLAPIDVWLKGKCEWNGEPWGPDVNWGLSLKELGYISYVDMDLHIGHKSSDRGVIWPKTMSNVNVVFRKDEQGNWKYRTS